MDIEKRLTGYLCACNPGCRWAQPELLRLGQAICIAYEKIIPRSGDVENARITTCFPQTTACISAANSHTFRLLEPEKATIRFDVMLQKESILADLQDFVKSNDWEEFAGVIQNVIESELPGEVGILEIQALNVHSIEVGTTDGPLEQQRRQAKDPAFVAEVEIGMPLIPSSWPAFASGRLLTPDINFLSKVSAALSSVLDKKKDDITTVKVFLENPHDTFASVREGIAMRMRILVDCRSPEEADALAERLKALSPSVLQEAFEKNGVALTSLRVMEVEVIFEDQPEDPSPSDSDIGLDSETSSTCRNLIQGQSLLLPFLYLFSWRF